MKLRTVFYAGLLFCLVSSRLFAASITNEGKTPIKLSGKTKSGVLAAMTINPGQTLPLRQTVLWVEHVIEGAHQNVNIKILEDNGTVGRIQTYGGRYTLANQQTIAPSGENNSKKPSISLQAGYALNNSNVEILVTLIKRSGRTVKQRIMPGQTANIPEDTIEVKLGSLNSHRGNEEVNLLVVMPDGKQHMIRSSRTSISISPEAR